MLNFQFFLPLKRLLVTTHSETHALTSREKVAEDTKSNQEQFKPGELFLLHASLFALEFSRQKC